MTKSIKEIIMKELRKNFKTLPPFEPCVVEVELDLGEPEISTAKMWLCYHEYNEDLSKGYHIAYEPIEEEWHVLEYYDNKYKKYKQLVYGGKRFIDAWDAM